MNKILVTGGAGFIGSNLVKALLKNKNKVIVVDNFSQGERKNLSSVNGDKNLKIIKADILDNKKMVKISKGVDVIFHLAVQCLRVSLNNPLFVERVNAGGTLSVLWAAHKNRVKKFIYCSSSEVYGSAISTPMKEDHPLNPTTVYGASKLTGETYTTCFNKNYSLKTVIVRPFNTYGYNEHMEGTYGEVIPRLIALAKNNLPLTIFGNGKQTRDFTFVTNSVDGLIKAANNTEAEGSALNIAYGEEVSINKITQIIIKATKSKSKIMHTDPRPHDVNRHFASISKATKLLGYKPKIDIEEGIKLYIKHLEEEKTDFKKILNDLPEKNW
jgi:UDP-glucose 4-epimerase